MTPPKLTKRAKRIRVLATLLAVPVGLLAVEFGLRFALFSDSSLAHWMGDDLRKPGLFANQLDGSGEDYWKIYHRFDPALWSPFYKHPELGWVSHEVDAATLRHRDEETVAERQLVLLYGSSHARYNGATTLRFPGLFDESPLGQDHALLNFATSGYGLCQMVMQLERTLPLYAEKHPLVLFTIMIDRDLDRAALGFRQMPQPKFAFGDDDKLEIIEPTSLDTDAYLEANPVAFPSYAWNYVLYGTSIVSDETKARLTHKAESKRLRRAILRTTIERVQAACETAGCQLIVVIQQDEKTTANPKLESWREAALLADLDELHQPFVSSAPILRAEAKAHNKPITAYYNQGAVSYKHPNDDGMRVLFKAFEAAVTQGLESH